MLIPILVFAVLAIVLLFSLIKSAETWNWIPITFVALIFLTGIFGGIAASRSVKMRSAWKAQYLKNEQQLADATADFDRMIFGATDTVDGYGEGSLRDTSHRLRLAQIGKGRVWENGIPSRSGEQFTLTFSNAAGEAIAASQLIADHQLFAFEASARVENAEGAPPAADFVGTFSVIETNEADNTVTLEPIFLTKFYQTGALMRQLSTELSANNNADRINQLYIELDLELSGDVETEFRSAWEAGRDSGDMSAVMTWLEAEAGNYEPVHQWSVFEKMPGDRRDAFKIHAGLAEFSEKNPATPEKLAEYRNLLATRFLPADALGMDPESAAYEELLDQYTFDGVKVNEINQYIQQNANTRISDRFILAENKENLFGLVRVNVKTEDYSVDGTGKPGVDGTFSAEGLANDPDLHYGKAVSFGKDAEVYLPKGPLLDGIPIDKQTSQPSFVSREDADYLQVDIFKRPLRDYPFQLREFRELTLKATDHRRAIEADIRVTDQMIADTNTQKANRDIITASLNSDIREMKLALAEINRLHDIRDKELRESQEKIKTLYNQIIELYRASDPAGDFLDTSTANGDNSVAESSR